MSKSSLSYRDFVKENEAILCDRKSYGNCTCIPCQCCCCVGPAPESQGPFLSSYIEAVGKTQTVASGNNIVFDVDESAIDIAGGDIEIDGLGSTFTIKRAGLYHVEWSVNLGSAAQPVLICLLENGEPSSALSNTSSTGNYSSGALINVTEDDIPFTISLHNFGGQITIEHPVAFENTAASIRILRFADGSAS